jgi:hypothetical protein
MLLRSAAAGRVAVVTTERSRTESGIIQTKLMRDGGLTTDPWVGRPEHFTRNTGYIEVGYINDLCHRFHSAHNPRNFRYHFLR